ncbi:hypothetical protein CAC42_6792 [Sphaceloma murrayae]|uniref:DUF7371 domain-containing protein n=1 Tax=Sphaceloma murrayae TaxID=2082308 RepID=A0A2K1QH95_9PEZI|nr:hypothetical protein CAC42_6792 [Sphaceloma murrayae]
MRSSVLSLAVVALGAAAQDISTCLASVNIITVTDTVVTTVLVPATSTVVTETLTVTFTEFAQGNMTAITFTYEPTSVSSPVDIGNNTVTSTLATAILPAASEPVVLRDPVTMQGPGASGWNVTTTSDPSDVVSAIALTKTSESYTTPTLFGRAAQLDDVIVGAFTETGDDGLRLAAPRRYPAGTTLDPSLQLIPLYPTTTSNLPSPTSACITGSAGLVCEDETPVPTTFTTRTIQLSTGTGVVPTETGCGEIGDFRFGWDDLPRLITNSTDITQAVPIFSPYRHFQFSEGYVYAPLPETPFQAVTPPHLAVFITNQTGAANVPSPGLVRPGELGAGLRLSDQVYWFNAYSAYLGCDDTDSPGCLYEISGYVYDAPSRNEVLAYQSNITIPACASLGGCQLSFVDFPLDMRGLSGFQIRAFAGQDQRVWFMDELALGWWDNSCEAGQIRARSRRRSID